MEKYLKMSDQFGMPVYAHKRNSVSTKLMDCDGYEIEGFYNPDYAEYVAHAINSHDELVAMNKELLAALEDIVDSFSPIQNPRDWFRADVHVRTIDIAKSAIEKAKAAS